MSAESVAVTLPVSRENQFRQARILRYAVGSSLAMALAMGIGWQLSFLAPVLTQSFLGSPAPRPAFKAGLALIAIVTVSCLVGLFLTRYLLPYPLVFIIFTSYLLFRLFYAKLGGASPLLITFMMISTLVIPIMGILSPDLGVLVAGGIVMGAIVTVGVVWLAHAIFPDPGTITSKAISKPSSEASIGRLRGAVLSTIVLVPVFILFYTLQLTGSVLILIFVALLAMQPSFAANFKAGTALIVGNVIGGAASILFYEILVIVPEFWFMVVLTCLFGLIFGAQLFSGKSRAPLFGMAFSTVLLVIASVTSGEGEAGSKVYTRVAQMMIAVVYVVSSFGLIERFRRAHEARA